MTDDSDQTKRTKTVKPGSKESFEWTINEFQSWVDRIKFTIPELGSEGHRSDWREANDSLNEAMYKLFRLTVFLQSLAIKDHPEFQDKILEWERTQPRDFCRRMKNDHTEL